MDLKLILDLIVACLLVATIVFAVLLNKRLDVLRKNRDELAKLIVQFNDATARAEASIPKLRRTAEEAGQQVQERVEKAQALRDDLAFMIERADAMADRLESGVRTARADPRAAPPPAPRAAPQPAGRGAPAPVPDRLAGTYADEPSDERSEAERELLRALQSAR